MKSGKEIVYEFFNNILEIEGIKKDLVNKVKELYSTGKLTTTNIQNLLDEMIEEELKNEN